MYKNNSIFTTTYVTKDNQNFFYKTTLSRKENIPMF